MKRHRSPWASKLGAFAVAAASFLSGGRPAWAVPVKNYTVNCTADVVNSSGSTTCATAAPVPGCPSPSCTLRAAIQASNANSGPTNTITVPAGVYKLSIPGRNEDMAATGDLDILNPVTITGAGASTTIIDGNRIDRVFDVFPNGTTTISGVTIRNGNPGGTCSATTTQGCLTNADCPQGEMCIPVAGGGIATGGSVASNVVTLNLSNVVVTQNTSGDSGGGIFNSDILSLTDVTVNNNTCNACLGGGIHNDASGRTTLERVTLSGNTGTGGGGLHSDSNCTPTICGGADALKLTNVTIYGNSVDGNGAGLEHDNGTATLINVTISNNTAPQGGGAFFNLGTATFKYTIFAHDPMSEACTGLEFNGNFTSAGHNIDVGTSCELACGVCTNGSNFGMACTSDSQCDVSGTCAGCCPTCPTGTTCTNNLCEGMGDIVNTDPGVAPLANNGGPTFTQALFAGSAALDKGGADCPPPNTDQRGPGFPRPGTGSTKCDIGAFEHQSSDPFPTTTTTTTTTTATTSTSTTTSTTTTTPPPTTTTSTTTTQPPTTTSTTSTTTTTTRPPTTTTTSTTTTSTTTTTTTTQPPPTTSTTSTTTTTTTTRPPTTTTTTTSTTTTTTSTTTTSTTTTSTTTTTTMAVLCGDVNGDGSVNIADALIVAQYGVGLRPCGQGTFSHPEVCDVNHDGACNIGDALKMAQCGVGLISCAFTCTPFSCPP